MTEEITNNYFENYEWGKYQYELKKKRYVNFYCLHSSILGNKILKEVRVIKLTILALFLRSQIYSCVLLCWQSFPEIFVEIIRHSSLSFFTNWIMCMDMCKSNQHVLECFLIFAQLYRLSTIVEGIAYGRSLKLMQISYIVNHL